MTDNKELFHELTKYIHQHGRDSIINDVGSICTRKYAIGTYSAPEQIGNNMHEFLNGYLTAFVTNRTLLWQYCDRRPCKVNPYGKCNELVPRLPWIMHIGELWDMWKDQNCSEPWNIHGLTTMWQRDTAEEIAMCCGVDNLTIPIIYFGTFQQHEYFSLHLPQARLSETSRRRAQLIFRQGEHVGYGILLKSSFHIGKQIVEDNNQLIRKHIAQIQQNISHPNYVVSLSVRNEHEPFFISLHLRHAHLASQSRIIQDDRGLTCLLSLIAKYRNNIMKDRLCIILFSTDRTETYEYIRTLPPEELGNCSVLTTDHQGHHIQHSEHGPYVGDIAVRDVELLSRADLLIGSIYNTPKLSLWSSSFSLLIAEFRSMNGRPYSISIPPVFTANCDVVIGSRIVPKDIYTNSSITCTAANQPGVNLPAECPYKLV